MKPDILPPMPTTPIRDDEYWRWFPRLEGWVLMVREPDGPLWPDEALDRPIPRVVVEERPWPDLD